jgi:REP element-mobilizing transposase RayT
MARRTKQLELDLPTCGGRRPGAGRKRTAARPGVPHRRRDHFAGQLPVHVTLRMVEEVYNLRSRRAFTVVSQALYAGANRLGVRLVQFSVQGNHIHLLIDAADGRSLARGVRGLSIRLARGLNRLMQRRGRVLGDRYHAHVLRTPTEVRRAIEYIRHNHRKHVLAGGGRPPVGVDPCSSDARPGRLPTGRAWLLTVRAGPRCEES